MSKINFYKENDDLLTTLLNKRFFEPWKKNYNLNSDIDPTELVNDTKLELFITPTCNQKCEYCYIARYGHNLYPIQERLSNEQILNNIQMVLDFFFDKKQLYIYHWELFAGDLFYDNL